MVHVVPFIAITSYSKNCDHLTVDMVKDTQPSCVEHAVFSEIYVVSTPVNWDLELVMEEDRLPGFRSVYRKESSDNILEGKYRTCNGNICFGACHRHTSRSSCKMS